MGRITVDNDYGANVRYGFDIEGDTPTQEEIDAIQLYLRNKAPEEKQLVAEIGADRSGVKDVALRYDIANRELDEEKEALLAEKFGKDGFVKLTDGQYALTPASREKIGQPGNSLLTIEDKGFSAYDLVDFAGQGGLAMMGGLAAGFLTLGLGFIPAALIGAAAAGGGKLLDEGIEWSRGLQRQSFKDVAKDAGIEAMLDVGGTGIGRGISALFGRLIKGGSTNAERAAQRELMEWSKESGVSYLPDIGSTAGKGLLLRTQAIVEAIAGNKRAPVIKENIENLSQIIAREEGLPVDEAEILVRKLIDDQANIIERQVGTVADQARTIYAPTVKKIGSDVRAAIDGGDAETVQQLSKNLLALEAEQIKDIGLAFDTVGDLMNITLNKLAKPIGKGVTADTPVVSVGPFAVAEKSIGLDALKSIKFSEEGDGLVIDISRTLEAMRGPDGKFSDDFVEALNNLSYRRKKSIKGSKPAPSNGTLGSQLIKDGELNPERAGLISIPEWQAIRGAINAQGRFNKNSALIRAARTGDAPTFDDLTYIYRSLTDDFDTSIDVFAGKIGIVDDGISVFKSTKDLSRAVDNALGRQGMPKFTKKNLDALKRDVKNLSVGMDALRSLNGVYARQTEIYEKEVIQSLQKTFEKVSTVSKTTGKPDPVEIKTGLSQLAEAATKNPDQFDYYARILADPLSFKEGAVNVLRGALESYQSLGKTNAGLNEVRALQKAIASIGRVSPEAQRVTDPKLARQVLGNLMVDRIYSQSMNVDTGVFNMLQFGKDMKRIGPALSKIIGKEASDQYMTVADDIIGLDGIMRSIQGLTPEQRALTVKITDNLAEVSDPTAALNNARKTLSDLRELKKSFIGQALSDPQRGVNLVKIADSAISPNFKFSQDLLPAINRLRSVATSAEEMDVIESTLKDQLRTSFFKKVAGNGETITERTNADPARAALNYMKMKELLNLGEMGRRRGVPGRGEIDRETLKYAFGDDGVKALEKLASYAENLAGRELRGKGGLQAASIGAGIAAATVVDPITTITSYAGFEALSRLFKSPTIIKFFLRPKKDTLAMFRQVEKGGIPENGFLAAYTTAFKTILDADDKGELKLTPEQRAAQIKGLNEALEAAGILEREAKGAKKPTPTGIVPRSPEPAPQPQSRAVSPQPTPTPQPAVQPAATPQPAPQAGIRTISAPAPAGISTALRQQTEQGLMQPYSGVGSVRV